MTDGEAGTTAEAVRTVKGAAEMAEAESGENRGGNKRATQEQQHA